MLSGLAAVGVLSFVPVVHAQPNAAVSAEAAFDAVSRILTGRDNLDRQLLSRLYQAMRRCRERLAPGGYPVVSNTTARNSRPYGGRPACCGANNCQPICPGTGRSSPPNFVSGSMDMI